MNRRVCQYLEIASKEILICPPADHQKEIVSLSEKKERNKQASRQAITLPKMSNTWERSACSHILYFFLLRTSSAHMRIIQLGFIDHKRILEIFLGIKGKSNLTHLLPRKFVAPDSSMNGCFALQGQRTQQSNVAVPRCIYITLSNTL